jgi:hypothetical protein
MASTPSSSCFSDRHVGADFSQVCFSGSLSLTAPLGEAVETFIRREDAERFIEEVRGDDPDLASYLRIEERDLEAARDDALAALRVLASSKFGLAQARHGSMTRPTSQRKITPPPTTTTATAQPTASHVERHLIAASVAITRARVAADDVKARAVHAPVTPRACCARGVVREHEYRRRMEDADRNVLEFIGDQGKSAEQVADHFPAFDVERLLRAELVRPRRTAPHKTQSPRAASAPDLTFYVLTSRGAEAIGLDPHTLHSD